MTNQTQTTINLDISEKQLEDFLCSGKNLEKYLNLKLVNNKNNGQVNISLPKKQLPKKLKDNIMNIKNLKLELKEWNWFSKNPRRV